MTEAELVRRLFETGTVLLDSILPDDLGGATFLFSRPASELAVSNTVDVLPALGEVQRHVASGGWAAGYVAYEAGYAFESVFEALESTRPLLWFGLYDDCRTIPKGLVRNAVASVSESHAEVHALRPGVDRRKYLQDVRTILSHIREGDIYQLNHTLPLLFDLRGDPLVLFSALRARQPVPYAAFLRTRQRTVASLSPELFFSLNADLVTTRPMKGTAPASSSLRKDRHVAKSLAGDPKNRAENLMIVDLLRNDLSRCCRPGSVVVSDLFGTQRYPTVIQMTSTIEGRLRTGADLAGVFRSLFPSGSVTGAPKIRAMELIRETEMGPRGVYCGAIGYVAPDRRAVFNVPIRTITVEEGRGTMGIGSGIVSDSVPEEEFDECMLKARFLLEATAP